MDLKKVCCICVLFSLLTGCTSESPINEKKKRIRAVQISINKNAPQQLTDRGLYGDETTLVVSEEDTQVTFGGDESRVPLGSPVIFVQSGSYTPETITQEEMRRYYTVTTPSGIPGRKETVTCNKDKSKGENLGIVDTEDMN